mmetsp:Transcript_20910/g.19052  ORF Transcript_20910/g.19052 Transcript_20910/m.19052 type:complete len:217 (+) Transcript_20910:25-675(+)
MAGRGARGGRGGRGGRWAGRASVAQDLIRDNFEDLGLDSFQQGAVDGRVPPPLYPVIDIPVPVESTLDELYCNKAYLNLLERIKLSSNYLTRNTDENDIKRYSDKYKKVTKKISVKNFVLSLTPEPSKLIPIELLEESINTKLNVKKRKVDTTLIDLEKAESGLVRENSNTKEEVSDNEDGEEVEDEDIDNDDDYLVDHYASDDDRDDDDDNEATF